MEKSSNISQTLTVFCGDASICRSLLLCMGAQMQVERISSLMKFIAYRSIKGRSIRGGVQLQGGVLFFNLYARGTGLLEGVHYSGVLL